jgi:hypothetical protein
MSVRICSLSSVTTLLNVEHFGIRRGLSMLLNSSLFNAASGFTCVPLGQAASIPVLSNTTLGGTGNAFEPPIVLPSPTDNVGNCPATFLTCGGSLSNYCCGNGSTCGPSGSCVNLFVPLPTPDFNNSSTVIGRPIEPQPNSGGCAAGTNPCFNQAGQFCCGGNTPQCGTLGAYCLPSNGYIELVNNGY